jgi:hypothetical protein
MKLGVICINKPDSNRRFNHCIVHKSANKFFATPLTVEQGTPPATARRGQGMKPQPVR